MGKHGTEYARIERDLYPTAPSWPVAALAEHVELRGKNIWEMACGEGCMARSLRAEGARVFESEISTTGTVRTRCSISYLLGRPQGFHPAIYW